MSVDCDASRRRIPLFLAELTRGVARRRLKPYPNVRAVLDRLRGHLPLAVVTDAQSAWARGELYQAGLLDYFHPVVVSGDHGYRKPDPRLFSIALDALGVTPQQTLYVGNDMYRDIYGARQLGMRTVMFGSDQGVKEYEDVVPDFTITDHRELLTILGLPDAPPPPDGQQDDGRPDDGSPAPGAATAGGDPPE
jgi:putative hydrolase of the HAD superfamily